MVSFRERRPFLDAMAASSCSSARIKCAGTPLRRALEIGCGHGVAREMLERDLGIPVDGCDLNRTALEMAKPGKGKLFIYNILDQDPSLLGRYDAVFLLDVIEHIDDDLAFLRAAMTAPSTRRTSGCKCASQYALFQ